MHILLEDNFNNDNFPKKHNQEYSYQKNFNFNFRLGYNAFSELFPYK
ncbi:hypothetical protein B739_0391 [Riemerella anatipestifer RA-CH-1]|uniref:Uncharacterized protein n=1 Tax=Riemerella anatipestifer RA-CH-1 TaxID=1228997 RepID=J9QXL0_RIEAN|nr:hypothetical protein B739_0391 [Riemerella anatipestifer RA-CH-1]AIH02006.1 hypothetical protein M949_0837 [Riemerella anatipestifer CH3]